uniref:Uncharacterized protein n=1 Tax=Triticum urartu TaxID=4572 RepID=A0A8R7TEZ7_TRIUA
SGTLGTSDTTRCGNSGIFSTSGTVGRGRCSSSGPFSSRYRAALIMPVHESSSATTKASVGTVVFLEAMLNCLHLCSCMCVC